MKKIICFVLAVIVLSLPLSLTYSFASFDSLMKEDIASEIYLLKSLDDSTVILNKGADKKTPCPALNKVLTVALALKNSDDIDETITITQKMLGDVTPYSLGMNLKVNEKISIRSLLYAIMLYGANDACIAIAHHIAGDMNSFVKMMNDYVASLGCENTVFMNPTGFDSDGQVTTANDISLVMADVVKIPVFMEIFGAKTYKVPATNLSLERNYTSGNKMLFSTLPEYYYSYVTGGKSGATDAAGYCNIVTATKDGYTYLCVILKGSNTAGNTSMTDAKILFKWAYTNIKFKIVANPNHVVKEISIIAGSESDHITLVPAKEISALVPRLADSDAVLIEPIKETVPEKLYAPIKSGDVICKARILYADEEIAQVDLVALQTVNLSVPRLVLEKIKDVLKSKVFIAVLIILVALILIYIVFVIFDNMKAKRNRMHIVGK